MFASLNLKLWSPNTEPQSPSGEGIHCKTVREKSLKIAINRVSLVLLSGKDARKGAFLPKNFLALETKNFIY